ncbi:radical SAM protein [candidate division KSB1 bacterium 4484_87]|nr:MAG: radical SAM protein [candidate division KSB1 bacterium 4484_87]
MSLGVDLVPHKTCSLNCVYCECGRTTNLTLKREQYVPTKDVINELQEYLGSRPKLDFVTFSGSGEPTLHAGIGEISDFIKKNYPHYKLALLTNGTLFYDSEVRTEVKDIDIILPSLDAATELSFKKINLPHPKLKIPTVIDGLVQLRSEFSGTMWLEVFIVPGINDNDDEIFALRDAIHRIKPDQVQLNTLDRPGTAEWVEAATQDELRRIAEMLDWETEIIANFKKREEIATYSTDIENAVLQMLRRRPCTVQDLSVSLGKHENEINKYIETLLKKGIIETKRMTRGNFFKLKTEID